MSVLTIVRSNKNSLIFLLFLVILPFFASSGVVLLIVKYESAIRSFDTLQWILLYFIAALTMSVALTHTTFIALIGGYFLGWISIVYMFPAYIVSSIIGYFAARRIDKGVFLSSISSIKGIDNIILNLKLQENLIIFFCRISPVLPFAMMNALLSILRADLGKYILSGSAGMLPRTLLFIWLGMQARNIKDLIDHPTENMASKIFFIVLLVFSVAGLFFVFRKIAKSPVDQKL